VAAKLLIDIATLTAGRVGAAMLRLRVREGTQQRDGSGAGAAYGDVAELPALGTLGES